MTVDDAAAEIADGAPREKTQRPAGRLQFEAPLVLAFGDCLALHHRAMATASAVATEHTLALVLRAATEVVHDGR